MANILTSSGQTTVVDLSDDVTMVLTKEAFVVPTDSSGNSGVFTNAVTTASVYLGTVDDTANWTFTKTENNTTTTQSGTYNQIYTISALSQDTGDVTITATKKGTTLTKKFSLSKGKQGNIGPTVSLSPNREAVFTFTDGTASLSTDIIFTAVCTGMTGQTYQWSKDGTNTVTTATYTLTSAAFGSASGARIKCIVTYNSIAYEDTINVVRLDKSTAAAGATKNIVTTGTSAPSTPQNGDIWYDTTTGTKVTKYYISGGWVEGEISAAKLVAGTIGSHTITLNDVNSVIQSSTFRSGTTLSSVQITSIAGAFQCATTTLYAGMLVTISGTLGGTGGITGYTNPTTYKISTTNGTTTFTLTKQDGTAIVTAIGTPTGLTYTLYYGWQIKGNGNAEYTNVTVRGQLKTGDTVLFDTGDGVRIFGNANQDNYSIGDTTTGGVDSTYGNNNLAFGQYALQSPQVGTSTKSNNVAIGTNALKSLASVNALGGSNDNIAIGRDTGPLIKKGINNILLGKDVLKTYTSNVQVTGQTLIGSGTLSLATSVSIGNTAIGYQILNNCTSIGSYNILVGSNIGDVATTVSSGSVFIGASINSSSTYLPGYSVYIGQSSGSSALTAGFKYNTFVGSQAIGIDDCSSAIVIGANATGTSSSIVIGNGAGNVTGFGGTYTGTNNIIIGYNSGTNVTSGSNNIIIGNALSAQTGSGTNNIDILTNSGTAGIQYTHSSATLALKAAKLQIPTNTSATAPSLFFEGNPNTGIYQSVTGRIDFTANGALALSITPGTNRPVYIPGILTINTELNFPGSYLTANSLIQMHSQTAVNAGMIIGFWNSAATGSGNIEFVRSSSASGINTYGNVVVNNALGNIRFSGALSSAFVEAARISSKVTAVGASFVGANLEFYTGSSTAAPTVKMTIDETGLLTTNSNIGGGGTANFLRADGTWAAPSVGAAADLTGGLLGSLPYQNAVNDTTFLAGNTTTTKMFLNQTGNGTISAAPVWSAIAKADVGLSNVENTALSTWAGSANITTVGTIGTGTWQGSLIGSTYGGTGVNNAGRTLTISTNSGTLSFTNASTTLTIANTGSISGTNTGDQTITLTGNVTGSGTGSFATTIAANAVTLAMMADVATGTVFYRKTAATGDPEVQTLATLKTDLGLTGTNSGDQTITLTGNVTGSGTGSFATTIAANAVTLSMMAQMATASFLGRNTAATGNVEVLSTATARTMLSIGNVENTALSTWAGSANITTVGTIGTGTWNATVIADNKIASTLTGKTYNGLTLTAAATGFTIAGGTTSKTLTVSNTLTFTGTDASSVAFGAGGTVAYLGGTNTWTGAQTFSGLATFSKGVNHGNEHFPTYKINLDFGSDVAGTWRRIVVASLANISFSTVGFRIRVVDPNANHATTTSVNADFETYMVACIRTESTTADTPDNCVVRGPSDRIRAVKTAVGSYEIQIQNQFANTEYQIEIDCYANNGSHTITYESGSTVGSTGTAQYTATVGSSIFFTERLTAKGSITADGGATFTAGQTVAFNNTAAAPFTVASTIQVTNLNASQLAGNSIGTSGATIPLCNGVNTFSGNTIFSGGTVTVGTSTGSGTYGLGTGATVSAATKTINIGISGVSGSTTNINIGSATSDTTTDIYGILEVLAAQTGGVASNGLIKIHSKDFGTVPATITQGAFNISTPWLVINSGTNVNSFVSIQSANNAYTWSFGSAGVLSAPGNISTTGQLVSTVTTGTAPLSVVSNTVVPNLNASLLSGNAVGTSGAAIPLLNATNTFSGLTTFSNGITVSGATTTLTTGTATVAPLTFASGTNLTTAAAGRVEYDGSFFYATRETTSGRGSVSINHIRRLAANGTAITTPAANFYGATSAINLAASSVYDVEFHVYFTKTTAGTVTFTLLASSAPTLIFARLIGTPATGVGAGTPQSLSTSSQNLASIAFGATASLSAGVNHVYFIKGKVHTNSATTFNLQIACSAGSATPLTGSYYSIKRISATQGSFA
jgi:hypothetical protein